MNEQIFRIIEFLDTHNYTAPGGIYWNKIYKMLPKINDKKPRLPLVLSGYHYSSDEEIRNRFIEHLEWAYKSGKLDKIEKYILSLENNNFYYYR